MKIIGKTYLIELTDADLDVLRLILNCAEDALDKKDNDYHRCISFADIKNFRNQLGIKL